MGNPLKKSEPFDYEKYLSSKATKREEASSSPENSDTAGKAAGTKKPRDSKASKKKPDKTDVGNAIITALDEALDEDVAEIAEFSVTSSIEQEPVPKKHTFRRSLYLVVGIIVSFMSVIGFISSVAFVANVIGGVADNTRQKEEFADIIYPLVIVDPAPYEQASQLASETVIGASIWDIILHGDVAKYPEEFGTMAIPQLDVEQHATSLFGSGLTFDHKTIGDAALSFYYTEETKSYNVPVSPTYFPYSPTVENIKRSGNVYTLRVGYISPSPAWLIKNKDQSIVPDKYMEYILTKAKGNGGYTVTSIKDLNDSNHIPSDNSNL